MNSEELQQLGEENARLLAAREERVRVDQQRQQAEQQRIHDLCHPLRKKMREADETGEGWTKNSVVGLLVLLAIVAVVVLLITSGASGPKDGAQTRRSNEQIGLSPPACINQQPVRCEREKAEAHQEEEGAKEAEASKEDAKRATEEAE